MFTRPEAAVPPLKDKNSAIKYFSQKDKAYEFGKYLASTMTPHTEPSLPSVISETDKFVEEFLQKPCLHKIPGTSVSKVCKFLKKLKNHKAPGEDRITNFILKKLLDSYIEISVKNFNARFRLNYISNIWKKAIVQVLQKDSKGPSLVSSYRPISLEYNE